MGEVTRMQQTLDEMLVQLGAMVLRLSDPEVTRTPEERHASCSVNQYALCGTFADPHVRLEPSSKK